MGSPAQKSSRSKAVLVQAKLAATPIAREFTDSEVAEFGADQLKLEGLLPPNSSVNDLLDFATMPPAQPADVQPDIETTREQ